MEASGLATAHHPASCGARLLHLRRGPKTFPHKGPKGPNMLYVWSLYFESYLWLGVYTSCLDTWTLSVWGSKEGCGQGQSKQRGKAFEVDTLGVLVGWTTVPVKMRCR